MESEILLEAIEVLVDPSTAEKIKKNGIAEIALRRKDQKIKSSTALLKQKSLTVAQVRKHRSKL